MSQATTAPLYPEPTPIFCNCSWQIHPFLLPEHGLVWILAIGSLSQVCRSDPETHSVLPLFASWHGSATYVFSDAWKGFCTAVALLVSPVALPIVAWRTTGRDRSQARRSHAWQSLRSLVTKARAGSKPAAVQLSEQTRLGLFSALRLPREEWLCQTPWLWQAPPPAASIPGLMPCLNLGDHSRRGSDNSAYMAGDELTATVTALLWSGWSTG